MKIFRILLGFVFCAEFAHAEIIKVERSAVLGAHGMYVKSQSEIWLADTYNRLNAGSQVYDSSGNVVKHAARGNSIAGIAKHPRQDLYSFCDIAGSQVYWLDSDGNKVRTLTIPQPWNARWTPSGDAMFIVTFGGSVLRVSGESRSDEIIRGLDAPFDIAPVGETSLWVSEQGTPGKGRVCFYDKASSAEAYEKIICNQGVELDNPEGLWPLSDGSVVAVDTSSGTLVKISKDGSTIVLAEDLGVPILVQLMDEGQWAVFTTRSKFGPAVIFGRSKELL
ncbi:hypothetical protein [Methylocystis sp. B8]|uniref:hypothetical protein n=1 Tax=Methylocystis sp. B8 TaxID=544938 RepID=UPI0010FDEAEC|nr:hypothetical protein [Methylocystis sp. B8]TLG76988.1 hypothetical protein FEV16_09650 [Methylocystis sp. B8]